MSYVCVYKNRSKVTFWNIILLNKIMKMDVAKSNQRGIRKLKKGLIHQALKVNMAATDKFTLTKASPVTCYFVLASTL